MNKKHNSTNKDEKIICKLRNDANEIKILAETDLTALELHVESTRLLTLVGR